MTHYRGRQSGTVMLVVVVLLTVMLLGSVALSRMTEIGVLASGNLGYREASLHASEVGINTAFERLKALTDDDANSDNWYWATAQTADSAGVPSIGWASAPSVVVGSYTVKYAVERMCNVAPVTDMTRQCLLKQVPQPPESRRDGPEAIEPPSAKQYRITVRVQGPKSTETWVQSLVTAG
jgi:Tfp pilus assembly protein PilX